MILRITTNDENYSPPLERCRGGLPPQQAGPTPEGYAFCSSQEGIFGGVPHAALGAATEHEKVGPSRDR
jgi:hypothetical protein